MKDTAQAAEQFDFEPADVELSDAGIEAIASLLVDAVLSNEESEEAQPTVVFDKGGRPST